ncbi:unnamed protein product [Urochloa humidicola]
MEESFKVTGVPSVEDLYPALQWIDIVRGIDAALARLQARRNTFTGGLVHDVRRGSEAAAIRGRDPETQGAIDELLSRLLHTRWSKGIVLTLFNASADTWRADF